MTFARGYTNPTLAKNGPALVTLASGGGGGGRRLFLINPMHVFSTY